MRELLEHVRQGEELSPAQVLQVVENLVDPGADETLKADFLRSLREKGETAGEIAAFVRALLGHAVDPGLKVQDCAGPVIDLCGTGGDRMEMFNVSTTAMFLAAAAGAIVVKHGNRGITSRCGGADVLEELGVRIDMPPAEFCQCVHETGLGFLFAPAYHPAFKAIMPVRKKLASEGVTTIFNMLGPLLNPVQPPYQLVGVFSAALLPTFAHVFQLLGRKRAWAVHGFAPEDRGVDEISTMGLTLVHETANGVSGKFEIDAAALGIPVTMPEALRGGDRVQNAALTRAVLDGSSKGPHREVTVINAAAALVVSGLASELAEGIRLVADTIESGAALDKLDQLRAFSRR